MVFIIQVLLKMTALFTELHHERKLEIASSSALIVAETKFALGGCAGVVDSSHIDTERLLKSFEIFPPRCFDSHFSCKKRKVPEAYENTYRLLHASADGCVDCARYLIEVVGVDVNSASMNKEYTPADWAKYEHQAMLFEYLVSKGGVTSD